VHGLAIAPDPFDSPLVPGGFVTKDQGFGHVVFVVSDLDSADRFARDALGFTQTDWIETDLGGMPLTVRFYHCNPRHHSIAFQPSIKDLPRSRDKKMWHFQLETNTLDAFMHLLREKIDGAGEPKLIHTVRGVGYTVRAEGVS
jgi:catechol 2,3-dioxygenase-like lactoylglutathione lyase family enzyme